jgi:PAS domain S-box-containing protein
VSATAGDEKVSHFGIDADPRILGQLLAAQSVFSVLPTPQKMGEFVCRAVEGVPGVASCAVCMAGAQRPLLGGEPVPECADCDVPGGDIDHDPGHVCLLPSGTDIRVLPLRTHDRHLGFLLLEVTEPEQYTPYEPFVSNLANGLAVNVERQWQRDLVDKRTAQLETAKEYAEALLRTSNAMVVGLGPDGEIDVFNDAAAEISGYTREEVAGRNWFETLAPRDRYPQVWQEFERLMEGGLAGEFENPILTKSGEERYIVWRNTELCREGRVVGTLSFGIDITARKRVEETLQIRNWLLAETQQRLEVTIEHLQATLAEKDRFVATVSHELRTPLSGVLGFASELRDRAGAFSPVEVVEFAAHIAQGCAIANSLVEDLLVVARLETGGIGLSLKPTDLHALASSMTSEPQIASRIGRKSITVEGLPSVAWADAARVHQILRNLMDNAGRYGGSRITIVVGTRPNTKKAFIRVVDDGPGVPEYLHEVLFQPYQHGAQESSRTESVGLGLYMSRKLAQLMGGDLTYRRQDGTTVFELTLPLPDEATSQDT